MDILKRNNVHVEGHQGPVLLYAHGFGCNKNMWNRITPAFRETHRQVTFDYVGSGKSDLRAFDPSKYAKLTGYAQDVLDICDTLDLKSDVIFVGHSISCMIGMLASIARPGLVDRFIMIGPSPCFINHPPDYIGGFERSDIEDLLDLMDQNYMGWANYLAPIAIGDDVSGHVSSELSDSFCSTDPVMARTFAQATFFSDHRDDLPKVASPSLILQHRHDALAPVSVGEYMHRHMPGSRLEILDVSGHCAHLTNPALVIDAMRNYLDEKSHPFE